MRARYIYVKLFEGMLEHGITFTIRSGVVYNFEHTCSGEPGPMRYPQVPAHYHPSAVLHQTVVPFTEWLFQLEELEGLGIRSMVNQSTYLGCGCLTTLAQIHQAFKDSASYG